MDIFAHALWAGVGVALVRHRRVVSPRNAFLCVLLAASPDLLHMLPLLGWWVLGDGSLRTLWSYAFAVPGYEPVFPILVNLVAHHLHCLAHSAIVAGLVTVLLWVWLRHFWIPLAGWWSHILIDVFTHSAAFYPSPVFYPISRRGFDGIAWNLPWFLLLNYGLLAAVVFWLWINRKPD